MPQLFRSDLLQLALKAAFTLFAFWFAFRDVSGEQLWHILATQDRWLLAAALGFMAVQAMMGAERWRMLLNAMGQGRESMGVVSSQKIYYIGGFFSCCLPGAVGGDVVRIWLTKACGLSLPISVNSVLVDRVIALVGVVLLALIALPSISEPLGVSLGVVYGVSAVLGAAGLVAFYRMEAVLAKFEHKRAVGWLLQLMRAMKMLLARPKLLFVVLVMALVAHVFYALSGYMLALSLNTPLSMVHSIAFIPLLMLVTTLPVSIGGWGVREAATVAMLGVVGIESEQALMISIQLGLVFVIMCLPAGLIWLSDRRKGHAKAAADMKRELA